MNTFRTLGMLTALGLASAASAQALAAQQGEAGQEPAPPPTQTQPSTKAGDPETASSPHQREVTGEVDKGEGTPEAPPGTSPEPSGAASPHQRETVQKQVGETERAAGKDEQMAAATKPKDKLVGLPVESSAGEPLGSVVDIVRDSDGSPTYAVVAIDNETTAVPYDTVASMVRDDKVVMSQSRLASSPKVKQSEWLDQTDTRWRTEADRYWGSTRTASPNDVSKPKER